MKKVCANFTGCHEPVFPLKTRETFSSRMHPSGITRKLQNELTKRQRLFKKFLVPKNMDLLEIYKKNKSK